jgi:predicted nucleic acid-binding protein
VAILLDSSAILAAADQSDLNHRAALAWFGHVDEPMLVGALTLGEVDLLLQRELGLRATLSLLEAIASGAIRVVAPTQADFARASELLREATEYRPRLTDAVLVATAERLRITRVAAFDRRPIAIFRPRHLRAFELEP